MKISSYFFSGFFLFGACVPSRWHGLKPADETNQENGSSTGARYVASFFRRDFQSPLAGGMDRPYQKEAVNRFPGTKRFNLMEGSTNRSGSEFGLAHFMQGNPQSVKAREIRLVELAGAEEDWDSDRFNTKSSKPFNWFAPQSRRDWLIVGAAIVALLVASYFLIVLIALSGG